MRRGGSGPYPRGRDPDRRWPEALKRSGLCSQDGRVERGEPRNSEEMSSLGTSKGLLEIGKFAVYVTVPIVLTYAVATDSKILHKLMGFVSYLSLSLLHIILFLYLFQIYSVMVGGIGRES